MRAACHRRVYDEPPAREPLALSLLGLTPFRGPCPQGSARRVRVGRREGKGEGRASASREPSSHLTVHT